MASTSRENWLVSTVTLTLNMPSTWGRALHPAIPGVTYAEALRRAPEAWERAVRRSNGIAFARRR
ncbi:hypothetical protein JCM2811A_20030 [Methylorubrum rhodinum]